MRNGETEQEFIMAWTKKEKMAEASRLRLEKGVGVVKKDINKSSIQCSVSNISFVLGVLEMRLKFESEGSEDSLYGDFVQGTVTCLSDSRSEVVGDCPECGQKGRQTAFHIVVTAVNRCSCTVSHNKVVQTGDTQVDEHRPSFTVSGGKVEDVGDTKVDEHRPSCTVSGNKVVDIGDTKVDEHGPFCIDTLVHSEDIQTTEHRPSFTVPGDKVEHSGNIQTSKPSCTVPGDKVEHTGNIQTSKPSCTVPGDKVEHSGNIQTSKPSCTVPGDKVEHTGNIQTSKPSCTVPGDKVEHTGNIQTSKPSCTVPGDKVEHTGNIQTSKPSCTVPGDKVEHTGNIQTSKPSCNTAVGEQKSSSSGSGNKNETSDTGNQNSASNSAETMSNLMQGTHTSESACFRRSGRKRHLRTADDTDMHVLWSFKEQAVTRSKQPRSLSRTHGRKGTENPENFKSHNNSNNYSCSVCDTVFRTKLQLTRHIKSQKCDSSAPSFDDSHAVEHCMRRNSDGEQVCQTDAVGKTNMAGPHNTQHKADKCFRCELCGRCFLLRTQLQTHLTVHTGNQPFTCGFCSKPFLSKLHLHKHMKLHLGGKRHTCDLCPKAFISAKDLEYHRTKHTGDKKFKCDICGSSFTVKASLKKHVLLHSDVKPFKCECCKKDFASFGQLQKHSRIHNTVNPLVCEVCGKTFPTNNYLQSHRKTHIGYEKHRCEVCGKSYREAAYLKIHMKSHTGEGLLKCALCWENFADPSYLKVHQKKFCRRKTVQCEDCGREFVNQRDLRLHRGVHSGERPHECQVCGKGFMKADALSEHARRHDDNLKTHKCDICSKGYVCASDLRKHKKTHNKVKRRIQLPDKFKYDLENSDANILQVKAPTLSEPGPVTTEMPDLSHLSVDVQNISLVTEGQDESPKTQIKDECSHGDKGVVKEQSVRSNPFQESSNIVQSEASADKLFMAQGVNAQASGSLAYTKASNDHVNVLANKGQFWVQGKEEHVIVKLQTDQVSEKELNNKANVQTNEVQVSVEDHGQVIAHGDSEQVSADESLVSTQANEGHMDEGGKSESNASDTEQEKGETEDMLLDMASISSPIHIDSLDPNSSLENALNALMSDTDQLLTNAYYKLNLQGRSST